MQKAECRTRMRGMRRRRDFLHSALCILPSAFAVLLTTACATVSQPTPTPTPAPVSTRFKILQLNDVYKIEGLEGGATGGLARVRTLRKHLESDGTPVLVLHAGDALYPSVMSKYLDARAMLDVLNMLDGDAKAADPHLFITFGNHELDKSTDEVLMARLAESQFRWVVTNTLHCKASGQCVPFRDAASSVTDLVTLDAGGTKVGLMGLLYPLENKYAKSTDVIAAARAAADSLRQQGARVVIAITHQDMPDDVNLVKQVPGIDIVIGGHDHLFLQARESSTWITKADADAKSVIVYDVTVPPSGPVQTAPIRVAVDTTIAKDPTVDAAVQRWMAALSEKLGGNDTLGTTKNLLEGVEPAVRGRETALGNLLADVARQRMKADVGFINGGGIRINDNIPPGPITKYDMEGVFYYTNKLVAVRITGAQLLDMLRNGVSRADSGDGRFPQVSGLKFTYHPPNFTVNPEDVTIGERPLDVNATYTVAISDFTYERGIEDGYTLFTDANRPPKINTDREADFRTTVEGYIKRLGTVKTGIEGRIVRGR
jgi:2',3'-cyclic-nucleotide 2'-phosphodiesterase (5'-nucleotidase family)